MVARCVTRTCLHVSRATPSSAAQAFLQLAPRGFTQHTPPIFEFLLPTIPARTVRYGIKQTVSRRQFTAHSFAQPAETPRTTVIFNPQKTEEGEDMNIEILPGAIEKLKELTTIYANPNLALRILVENGGCHGFQTKTALTTLPSPLKVTSIQEEASSALNTSSSDPNAMPSPLPPGVEPLTAEESEVKLEDVDSVFAAGTARVVVDSFSLVYLKNSRIDFTNDLMGSEFKIVENPNASTSCGCGVSFNVDD